MTIDSGIPYATSPGGMSTSNGSYILGTIPAPGTGRGLRDVVSSWSACSGVASENPKLQRVWTATHLYWYSIPPSDNIYDRNNYGFFVEPYEKDYFYNDSEVLDMLARSEAFPSTPTYGFTTLKLRWYPANATMQKNLVDKPSYYSLVSGYKLDKRYIPQSFILASVIDKRITLKYYRENKLEPIPELKSLIWHIQSIDLKAGIPTPFFVSDIALGTLHVSESDIKEQIKSLPTEISQYPYKYLFSEHLPDLFDEWNSIYNTANINKTGLPVFLENRLLRKLAANNNVWANSTPDSDLNVDSTHPMFAIDEDRSFEWHLSPQSEGIGALIMDSPRTIESLALLRELRTALQPQEYQVEDLASTPNKHHLDWYIKNSGNNKVDEIWKALNAGEYLEELPATIGTGTIEAPEIPALHKLDYYIKNTNSTKLNDVWKALDAGKYSINDLDPTKPLIPNLGFLIKNTARVLGLRLDANGNVDRALEKAQYLPATLNNPTLGDKDSEGKFNDYSMSCWGLWGRMMPHLPTAYAAGGKPTALYDVFHDIPQQLEAILRQFDISLGIQHGSEIRLPGLDSKIHAYPNQLAMQQEMLRRTEAIQQATSKIQNIVLVNSQETREIVSGIGFATTQKYLQLRDGSGSKQFLPYFGHQKNMPSIAQRLTTVDINLAIQNGVLMPKKQPDKATVFNPFNLFKPKS